MKKALTCVLAVTLCIVTAACTSTFGMEEQNDDTAGISFKIGDYMILGKYYDKPILWRYVASDENGMLMLSDRLLCRKAFDEANSRPPLLGCRNYWGYSNIRSWLNSSAPAGEVLWLRGNPPKGNQTGYNGYDNEKGFLADGNFTQSERNAIKEVSQKSILDSMDAKLAVGGSKEAWGDMYSKYPGNEYVDIQGFIENQYDEICFEYIIDKVFLLDVKQLWNISQNKGILGGGYCSATLTQEAIDNDEENQSKINESWYSPLSTEEVAAYWIRTPFGWGYLSGAASGTGGEWMPSGSRVLVTYGSNRALAEQSYKNYGIRPAFYLDEGAAEILSGSGTEEDPYVINGKKNDKIHVYCDWRELNFDVQPVNEDGRVLVPMRKIFETLGASITWDEPTRTVTAVKGETTVSLQIDQREMYVNGQMVWLDVPPQIVGDRTLIPIRAISEALGAKVEWLEESRRINITT